ncbi:restriction endonuclease subunit S [Faecalibacterium prausnitzii]|uniref:restriction endonuclease subunit S n=1 Tax=Faecalibacterium prausnitzii TaxID=853 RepID=UPI00290A7228|nr:restriction endonuclease subunit S [Faecalibacterium prausnitzii]MDU8658056.1 restriction endonuclease subunit S [Faecalibacterium prausnitzii]
MKSEWKTIRADEFCSLVTDGTHDSPKPQAAGRKLITSKHLKGYYLDFESANWISSEDYEKVIARSSVEQWDILYSMIGTIGNVYLEKNPVVDYACKNVGIFKFGGNCNKAYWMYYYLKSPQAMEFIKAHLRGTTQLYVPLATLREMPVPVPDEEEMNKIVAILRTLDDKIQCSIKINDNLEQQAAALFSSLYNRSNTEVRYTDLIQILGGGTPKTGETAYWNGNIAFFTPKDVGTPYTFITEKTITEEGLSHCNSRLYPVNTVFVTARGTVGKVGLSGVPMAMNQSCYALVGKETHQLLVYFYTLKAVDRLKHKASGAVFDAITTRDFDSEQIMKLSDDDAKAFLCVAEPMFQEILNNSIENLRLSTLRDFLLPKLMSGEIDVSSVQL